MPGTPDKTNRNNRMEKIKPNTAMEVLKCLLSLQTRKSLLKKNWHHGTIIRTRIACQKTPCYMRDSTCKWFIVIVEVMLNIFQLSRV